MTAEWFSCCARSGGDDAEEARERLKGVLEEDAESLLLLSLDDLLLVCDSRASCALEGTSSECFSPC